ncbi:MAG: manganese transport protein, partial [Planctomycetota bacterium]
MATPPDPGQLAAEKDLLRELEHAPTLKRWRGYLKFIGPGYMQSAMTLGSGTAASSLFAGAVFGYDLLWVAPLGMVIGILVMGVVSHQTLSTGQRVLPAMAKHANKWLAWSFALAAVIASIVWHFPQYNLAAASLADAANTLGLEGVPKMAASTFVLVWAVVLSTMYGKSPRFVRLYEQFLKYTVWGIVVLLLWVLINTETDWAGVAAGFIPSLPEDRDGFSSIDLAVAGIAAAVG